MSRAEEIASMSHATRHTLVTDAEWRGWLWWMHDRDERHRPPGGDDGVEAAKILIARDKEVAP